VIPLVYGAMLAAPAVATAAARYSRPIINGIKTIGKKIAQSTFGQSPVGQGIAKGTSATGKVIFSRPMMGAEVATLVSGSTHSDDKEKEPESEPHVDDGSDIPTIDLPEKPLHTKVKDDSIMHYTDIGPDGEAKVIPFHDLAKGGNGEDMDQYFKELDTEYHRLEKERIAKIVRGDKKPKRTPRNEGIK
jgi:hypothetical protein